MLVTHDVAIARRADRIVRLAAGRVDEPSDPSPSLYPPCPPSPDRKLTMPRIIFMNDRLVPEEEAKVSVFDHGLLYGDGVFEGLRSYCGKVFRLDAHLDRLWDTPARSASRSRWRRRPWPRR